MNLPSSSTSSSEAERGNWKRVFALSAWVLAFLIVLDVVVNLAFAYPSDPKAVDPGRLQLYFDYGRSMEGRLRRATRLDPRDTAPITLAGWYDPLVAVERDAKPAGRKVTIYGNSFSVRLADALQGASGTYAVRSVAGPGATANWAHGAFLRDKREAQGEAVVLTVMPTNLPMIETMAAMTWNTSFAMPYTADRFEMKQGRLVRHRPPYESFASYVATLDDPARWDAAKRQFAAHDRFYDRFLFEQSWTDNSTILRLIRRGWGQRRDSQVRAESLNQYGYNPHDEAVVVANGIVADFAEKSRKAGLVPVIYIVNSLGYRDQMYRALADTLARHRIPYVSSHTLVDPENPANYLSDSHFTDANDRLLAQELERVVDRELALDK